MRPHLRFRPVKLKKLNRGAVVHYESNRDTLRWTTGFYQYLLSSNRRPNVVNDKGHMGDSLDQLRQRAVRVELHPLHSIGTLKIP
jgi:hypothetical protein